MDNFKFRTWKYKDATFSEQWDKLLDGEWPYGEINEKVFIIDKYWYE